MWKTFAGAIALLTVAMIAALYSSSANRDGRLPAAIVSALIALLIAIWVGVRFVPRLASNVGWEWLPFSYYYRITREGWIYVAAVLVVVFAAVNTSNNLLYMVLSALLAVMILSGFFSGLNFRDLQIHLRIPSRCFYGEPFPVSIDVSNEKRVFPSFSLEVGPPTDSELHSAPFYITAVRAGQRVLQSGSGVLVRRGHHLLNEIKVLSRYPFGFFVKNRSYSIHAECICYPEIIPVEQMNLNSFVADLQGSSPRLERGVGCDLYTIRDYIPSDSARHVHWKASAKTATLKTREYTAEENRRVVLAFDRSGSPGDSERFEQLVSYAASLACLLVNEGIDVTFVSDDWQSGSGSSQSLLESILEYLAVVNMADGSERAFLPTLEGAIDLSLRNFSPGGRTSSEAADKRYGFAKF